MSSFFLLNEINISFLRMYNKSIYRVYYKGRNCNWKKKEKIETKKLFRIYFLKKL